ncbi:lysophospholipase L1-like esterase [Lewinella aquimaris]|uniref:Lysophospholipase L1-like esterase n=1 Tax=Neolewinella aquimaris TaxID=1835722 RepID=A0A840DXA1_9BACT|nr:SGNH/GDSL hydrolase family protein [Neolewinella aquimaris]MBB4077560.1 lysophospholipase L1-like esterase [Neolewinella aquimaris]
MRISLRRVLFGWLGLFVLLSAALQGQDRDTILVDFGSDLSATPWNNVTDPVAGTIERLLNRRGNLTTYGIAVTDPFNNVNTGGTKSPDASTGLPATASGDSFFGNVTTFGGQVQPTGAVQLRKLRTDKEYTLSIFASRVGANDNRQASYALASDTKDTLYLDASENTDQLVTITLRPAADSTITITAAPGPDNDNSAGFYYLGALVVTYDAEDAPPPPPPPVGEDVADTVLVDFGGSSLSAAPWNNVTDPQEGSIADLLNSSGFQSGFGISVFDPFNGINTAGTVNPDPALDFPGSATGDSFFGNVTEFSGQIQPTGGVELTGLDPEVEYTMELFASRNASDNRETTYALAGATNDTVYLDAASNTDEVATVTLRPDAEGKIQITASTGPNNTNSAGFYYLGLLRLTYPNQAPAGGASLSLLSPNGGEFWQAGKQPTIRWSSRNLARVVLEYSENAGRSWSTIDTVVGASGAYAWTVPNTPTDSALVRILSDTLTDSSDDYFTISSDTTSCRIVVLGSSTAEGTGASTPDSAWVNRYARSLEGDTRFEVINLGRGGYTTYHILPTGSTIPPGVNIVPDVTRNVTKALSFDPFAIIVNMPSNDAANNFPVADQLSNFANIVDAANEEGVNVYVATTQPRNFTNTAQVDIQREVRDSILARYGERSIDFWTGLAADNGFILDSLDSGDGVHLNDGGHRILFERVRALQLDTLSCGELINSVTNRIIPLQGVSVFPNPTNGQDLRLGINLPPAGQLTVQLFDVLGRIRFQQEASTVRGETFRLRIPAEGIRRNGTEEPLFVVVTVRGDSGISRSVTTVF